MKLKILFFISKKLSSFKYSKSSILNKIYNYFFIFSENFLFNDDYISLKKIKEKKILDSTNINIFFFPFWGETYTNSFFRYCLPSLLSEENLPWLNKNFNLNIHFYSEFDADVYQKEYSYLKKVFKKYKFHFFNIDEFNSSKIQDVRSNRIFSCYIHHAKICLKENATSINIPIDHVFSNNYLKNYSMIFKGKPYSYTHPHVRVKSSVSETLDKLRRDDLLDISNSKLVDIGFDHLTYHFQKQNDNLEKNLTHLGFSWREINKNIISLVPGILGPTVNNFIEEDINYLEKFDNWSVQDRQIPKYLLSSRRMKCVASSDLLFSLEITFVDDELQEKAFLRNNIYNDLTKSNNFSSNIFNTIVCSLRK